MIGFLVWVALWAVTFTEHPKGSSPHHGRGRTRNAASPPRKRKLATCPGAACSGALAPVTIVYFCYGWTLLAAVPELDSPSTPCP
ncbi:hypothetical protein ACU4GD_21185 [Cupriavidus basilensis]